MQLRRHGGHNGTALRVAGAAWRSLIAGRQVSNGVCLGAVKYGECGRQSRSWRRGSGADN